MAQHMQVGEYTRSVNEHGVIIEHSSWLPSRLEDGRCCGRKTHPYKKALAGGPGTICLKCGREYDLCGDQRHNWAYRLGQDGIYHRDEPKGPSLG